MNEGEQNQGYLLRDRSTLKASERYSWKNSLSLIAESGEPISYEEATTCSEAKSTSWIQAMNEEVSSLKQNKTWTLVVPPTDHPIIDNRWTYKVKTNNDGSIQRFKARLLARGFKQQAGVDYHETFSPVARFNSIRTILSVAASRNLKLQHFDIKTAFLHGELEETIFMKQPKGL